MNANDIYTAGALLARAVQNYERVDNELAKCYGPPEEMFPLIKLSGNARASMIKAKDIYFETVKIYTQEQHEKS